MSIGERFIAAIVWVLRMLGEVEESNFNGGCCDRDMEHEPKGENQCG